MIRPEEFICEHRHSGLEHPACYIRYLDNADGSNVGFLDIETSQLNAEFGFMITWSIKKLDEKVAFDYLRKKDFDKWEFDKRITQSILKELKKYSIIYTYYGTKFDIPFIRSRALKYNLNFPVQGQIIHRDLYYITRNKLKLVSNRLKNATHFLGIQGKTELSGDIWARAAYGNSAAISYIL
ncbi:MAG: ribonuclease H-like domain-containing protein, partial [Thermoplasmata archaeon]